MKRVHKGVVSNLAHTALKVGDVVLLGPPAGVYQAQSADKPKVLVSAGIGITTSKAFLQGHQEQVTRIVHVDRTEAHVPWLFELRGCGVQSDFFFTSQKGRPDPQTLFKNTLAEADGQTEFYICGPLDWMKECSHYLVSQGHTKVLTEVFGTGTVSKCPVSAMSAGQD